MFKETDWSYTRAKSHFTTMTYIDFTLTLELKHDGGKLPSSRIRVSKARINLRSYATFSENICYTFTSLWTLHILQTRRLKVLNRLHRCTGCSTHVRHGRSSPWSSLIYLLWSIINFNRSMDPRELSWTLCRFIEISRNERTLSATASWDHSISNKFYELKFCISLLKVDKRKLSVLSFRLDKMGSVKRKSTFEHAQNAQIQIILRMRKVSAGPVLSIRTFCSIQWLC